MDNVILSVGNILEDCTSKNQYRIIHIQDNVVYLCRLNVSKIQIEPLMYANLIGLIENKDIEVMSNTENAVFDITQLPEGEAQKFRQKKNMMNEIVEAFGPTFLKLQTKAPKPELTAIIQKYGVPYSSARKMIVHFLQSGMQDISLVDSRIFGVNTGKIYQPKQKVGRKSGQGNTEGVAVTDEVRAHFDEALKWYSTGRQKTIQLAYTHMNKLYYTCTEIEDGTPTIVLLPESQRPTLKQFRYYCDKHLSPEEKDRIKTSAQEQRNDKRLLLSDSLNGVVGPGDMVEVDACEADVSLVSTVDRNKTVGRPIVYFMIDVYTRIILAVSVAFDNNSELGITNLFLNLSDDKHEFCKKYGMNFEGDAIWPSNILPKRLRADRGSEFKSNEFGRICVDLHIDKQLVPGATGSYKGIVEQEFHQMHMAQNVHLENYGLIEKRYDSNHHEEATLNIYQYTQMIINFVLTHNQKYIEKYPLTKDMIDHGIKAIPAALWAYGVEKYGTPSPIPSKEQYMFNLMKPKKVSYCRRGIYYNGLWYYAPNDKVLNSDMWKAGNKRIPFEVRVDPRDVGAVYYIRDNKLITAKLNPLITGNADYAGMTEKEYDDYKKAKGKLASEGNTHNEELAVFSHSVNQAIVDSAKKETYSDPKNMRVTRETDKQAVSKENSIAQRLQSLKASPSVIAEQSATASIETDATQTHAIPKNTEQAEKTEEKPEEKHYTSFKEALEDIWG